MLAQLHHYSHHLYLLYTSSYCHLYLPYTATYRQRRRALASRATGWCSTRPSTGTALGRFGWSRRRGSTSLSRTSGTMTDWLQTHQAPRHKPHGRIVCVVCGVNVMLSVMLSYLCGAVNVMLSIILSVVSAESVMSVCGVLSLRGAVGVRGVNVHARMRSSSSSPSGRSPSIAARRSRPRRRSRICSGRSSSSKRRQAALTSGGR